MNAKEKAMAPLTRRTVVKTGVKLAYATPILAASMHLSAGGALGVQDCSCLTAAAGWVFDDSPPLDSDSNPNGFDPACCTCFHCIQLGAPNPTYDATNNTCLSDGVPTDRCYPICTDVCEVVSP